MDSLPVPAVVGAAVAALGLGFVLVRKALGGGSPAPTTPAPTPGRPAPLVSIPPRASVAPRPSLRPSMPPPSLRESIRTVFIDPALNKNGIGFGRKCEWIVAKTTPETLAAAVGVTGAAMPWREALARAEGFAWLRARPGLVERAFSVVDTHTLADDGPQDEIEEHVRGQRPVPDGEEWWPSEEDVLEMAAGWSVDPWALDDRAVGDMPCLFAERRK